MKINNILVTGRIYKEIEAQLQPHNIQKQFRFVQEDELSDEDFLWADAYVGFQPAPKFTFGNLKWVHSLGAGVDRFLLERDWNEDVLLTRTICSFGRKISEYCLSYMLRDLQHHHTYEQLQSQQKWQPVEPKSLSAQKVVVYGTGEIGQEVAKTLALFDAEVIGVSMSGQAKPYFKQVMTASEASAILQEANWVISTLPLTKQTEQLFTTSFFEQLHHACFMNVGRGRTIDEAAMLQALERGNLRLAVLDVFDQEPLPQSSLLWEHPNVFVTPHISAITSPKEAVACFLDTLSRIEQKQTLVNQVHIEKGY